jgi:tRNA A22 N-methylase
MLISREELRQEWLALKNYDLTDEEIVGMMEFFNYEMIAAQSKMKRLSRKNIGGNKCINLMPMKLP